MRIFARLLVLLPPLWVALCASAYGAEQIEQITLVRAVSNDAVDALREFDPNTLRAKVGDTLVLRLAVSGPYEITIDQARRSSLGNTIIRGTTPSGGTSLMVIGADGSVRGHFERPDKVVQVSSDEDGVVTAWIEGVDAKMLPINDKVIIPPDYTLEKLTEPSREDLRDVAAPDASATSDAGVSYARFKTGDATIRTLIYYEDTMNAVSTVADYLVEITNTAFKESGVSMGLEIVAFKPAALGPPPKVSDVLDLMWAKAPPFNNLENDLSAANADLVATLISSYNSMDPYGGIASIGRKFGTQRFSVTRYRGYQSGGSLYSTDVFAHEVGHNLGARHNREQYENNGQDLTYIFSYASGYLIEGVQRTIMSYGSQNYGSEGSTYLFSNPALTYAGYPVGISTGRDDSAFVARAFTNNRHVAAGKNEFAFEQIGYESVLETGNECGTYRGMRIRNQGAGVISVVSENYVKSDGSIVSYPLVDTLPEYYFATRGYCRTESEPNPLGTTYTQSFFRYRHPTTGELIEGPRFQWGETYIPQSEVRIAYTDGGKPTGNTVRMIPVGNEEDVVFQPDRGFALDEIKSTCEGTSISGGFRVRATLDPCLLEASFSASATPPSAPIIVATDFGDGEIVLAVSVGNDGGTDVTGYDATCTDGTSTYTGTSSSSQITVSGLTNGIAYTCTVTATNAAGKSSASAPTATITPEYTISGLPIWLLYQISALSEDNDGTETTFIVTASAGTGGSITPAGALTVAGGSTVSFTLAASSGYSFSKISGTCPSSSTSATTHITGAITQNCTVTSNFTADNTSGYCAGTPTGVICDPNADGRSSPGGTMDSWGGQTWGFENTPIPNGKVVAYPFLANAGAGNSEGIMEFWNNMPDLTGSGYTWKGWFSETPGGAVMNNNNSYCRKYSVNPNPQQLRWSQSSDPNRFACNLGQTERVLYFNMAIGCYEEVLATVPIDERNCTVGAPFQGVGGYSNYYIFVQPLR